MLRRSVTALLFCIGMAACGDDSVPSPPAPGECAPRTLDSEIRSEIGLCTDITCATWITWGTVPPTLSDPYSDALEARCVVDSTRPHPDGGTWWIFRDCTGDMLAANQVIGLLWWSPLPLALVVGKDVRIRHQHWSDGFYKFQNAWALHDGGARPIAMYSRRDEVPGIWLTAPVEIEMSEQACAPSEQCSGENYPANVTVRIGTSVTTIASGNVGVVGDDPILDVFVFKANIGRGFACGAYSDYRNLSVALVAR